MEFYIKDNLNDITYVRDYPAFGGVKFAPP